MSVRFTSCLTVVRVRSRLNVSLPRSKFMLLKIVRNALGMLIVFFDWLTRPKKTKRDPESQARAQAALEGHTLYQLYACPFCVKTRRAVHRLGVNVTTRDINKDPQNRISLQQGGGQVKVPCLRIDSAEETQWMYESSEIIQYLESKVA